jgi:hypothetical protein
MISRAMREDKFHHGIELFGIEYPLIEFWRAQRVEGSAMTPETEQLCRLEMLIGAALLVSTLFFASPSHASSVVVKAA